MRAIGGKEGEGRQGDAQALLEGGENIRSEMAERSTARFGFETAAFGMSNLHRCEAVIRPDLNTRPRLMETKTAWEKLGMVECAYRSIVCNVVESGMCRQAKICMHLFDEPVETKRAALAPALCPVALPTHQPSAAGLQPCAATQPPNPAGPLPSVGCSLEPFNSMHVQ
jgi:hypothetical protein